MEHIKKVLKCFFIIPLIILFFHILFLGAADVYKNINLPTTYQENIFYDPEHAENTHPEYNIKAEVTKNQDEIFSKDEISHYLPSVDSVESGEETPGARHEIMDNDIQSLDKWNLPNQSPNELIKNKYKIRNVKGEICYEICCESSVIFTGDGKIIKDDTLKRDIPEEKKVVIDVDDPVVEKNKPIIEKIEETDKPSEIQLVYRDNVETYVPLPCDKEKKNPDMDTKDSKIGFYIQENIGYRQTFLLYTKYIAENIVIVGDYIFDYIKSIKIPLVI